MMKKICMMLGVALSGLSAMAGPSPFQVTTPSPLPSGMVMVAYTRQLQATNGTPPYVWSVAPQLSAFGENWRGQTNVPLGLSNVTALAAGGSHNLALLGNKTVVAWGDNAYGQAGVPSGLTNVTAVAAGGSHSLALCGNGTVVAWGADGYGQTDVPPGLTNVTAIAAGGNHSLALLGDGTVVAWGDDTYGQTDVSGWSDVKAVSAGGDNSLALLNDGTVVAVGDDSYGQVDVPPDLAGVKAIATGGAFNLALLDDGTLAAWGDNTYGQINIPSGLGTITAVSAGQNYSMVVDGSGVVSMWGDDSAGQIDVPPDLTNAGAIAAGGYHALALRNDGTVAAWGWNGYGQGAVPADLMTVVAVAAGTAHSLALQEDGTVVAWGASGYQYGQTSVPGDLTNATAIAAGDKHSMALRADGSVAVWGYNEYGQLNVPGDLTNAVAIAAGDRHSLALRGSGAVAAWGDDTYGQVDVSGWSGVKAIAAGGTHSLALLDDGTVVAVGDDTYGQIDVPSGLGGVKAVAAGGRHSLALCGNGTVVAWGDGSYGQTNVPSGLTNVVKIAAGGAHSLALCSNGTVVAWGADAYGQADVPAGLGEVMSIAAGRSHSLALRKTSTQMPSGLLCSTNGLISGIPLAPGTNGVKILVRDAIGQNTNKTFQLVIDPSPNLAPVITSNSPPAGAVVMDQATSLAFRVWAYDPESKALTYRWTWDALPVGGNSNAYTRTTSWTDSGIHQLTCYVSDDLWSNNVYTTWDVTVQPHVLQIVTAAMPAGKVNVAYSRQLQATNGPTPYTWSVASQVDAWGDTGGVPDGLNHMTAIAAGGYHSLALGRDGIVRAWGSDISGQADVPAGLSNVVAVAAGGYFSLALRSNGTLRAWGNNGSGQTNTPAGLTNVVAIAAGSAHGLALRGNGTVVAWGGNSGGQTNVPPGLTNVVAVAAGWSHSLALCGNGTVVAWGTNASGQVTVPPDLGNVVAIAAGGFHNLALCSNGTVRAWGADGSRQSDVPAGLSNVVAVAAGTYHSLALRRDGTLAAWGDDGGGQIDVPAGLGRVMGIAGGAGYTLVLLADSSQLPDGLACSSNGLVSGMSSSAASNRITFVAMDAVGVAARRTFDFIINGNLPPVISTNTPPAGAFSMAEVTSQVFSVSAYDPEGSNLVYSWTWAGLPVGGNSNAYTRTTVWGDAGTNLLQCRVADEVATNFSSISWTVTVLPHVLRIVTAAMPTGKVGVAYAMQLQATNGPAPYVWNAVSPLPDGMDCSSNGLVAGVPVSAGTNSVSFMVRDAVGVTATGTLDLVINPNYPPVVITNTPPAGAFSMAEATSQVFSVSAYDPEGSNLVYSWIWAGLPVGGNSNAYTRTTTWGDAGTNPLQCRMVDNLPSNAVSVTWAVTVQPHVLQIVTTAMPTGKVNVAYAMQLQATNGPAPYVWSAISPLPGGLACSTNGLVSGVPLSAGTNSVSFLARDAAGVTATGTLDLVINPNFPPVISSSVPPAGAFSMAEATSQVFSVSAYDPEGSNLVYSWTWAGLPVGGNSNTYTRTTTWGDAGTNPLQCKVADDVATNFSSVSWTVTVQPHVLQILTAAMPTGKVNVAYAMQLQATNGPAPYIWSVAPQVAMWGGGAAVPDGLGNITAIAAGSAHSLALVRDGTVRAWGNNGNGQATVPAGLTNVVMVAAGRAHSLALRGNGTVAAWGINTSGQRTVPAGLANVVAVAAGWNHNLAVCSNGTVVAWGSNSGGQTNVPAGLSNVVMVAAGSAHSLALCRDGTVVAWGTNSSGQADVPAGLGNVVAIAAGSAHNVALYGNGTVVAWGGNSGGQTNVPPGLTNVVAVAAGDAHSLALCRDGTVVAWGTNSSGQATVPAGLTNVVAVAGGTNYSLVLLAGSSQLQDGLVCSTNGVVSGTPVSVGTNHVSFVARDAVGTTASRTLDLVINPNYPPVVITNTPPAGAFSMAEATSQVFAVSAYDPEGSNLVYSWTWAGLPVGGNSNAYTRATAWGDAGTNQLQCRIADDMPSNGVSVTWTVTVLPHVLQVVTAAMPTGKVGVAYSQQLQATNGPAPYTWSVTSPLPGGLACSTNGLVSGVPLSAGTNSVSFTARDAVGTTAGRTLDLVITPAINLPPVVTTNTPPAGACVMAESTSRVFSVSAYDPEGGALVYSWTWAGLPVGGSSNAYTRTTAWGDAGTNRLQCRIVDDQPTNAVSVIWTVTVLSDNDGDGMPNAWERTYGLDPNNPADAAGDKDGDTMLNYGEYLAGTIPDNPTSRLEVETFVLTNALSATGGIRLVWSSVSGRTYRVAMATNLMNSTNYFVPLARYIAARPPTNTFQTNNVDMAVPRFYRIELEQ